MSEARSQITRAGSQVAYNDDSCSLGSKITYTPSTTGTRSLDGGCCSSGSCTASVTITP